MELWDGYNRDGTLAGVDIVRGERVPDGVYHLVCEILVRHTDGEYLLMKRDPSKPSFPGYYEASAGGAVQKGENSYEGALRELREETGIVADKLELIDKMVYKTSMIVHQYLCVTDCAKDSIVLQEGETVGYKWVSLPEFIEFITSDKMIKTQRERMAPYFKRLGYIK